MNDDTPRQHAEDETIGALVELDIPMPRLSVQHPMSEEVGRPFRFGVPEQDTAESGSTSAEEANSGVVERVRTILEAELGLKARWLRSSQSFVIRATPEQIRKIEELPDVKKVWPNRELRLGAV